MQPDNSQNPAFEMPHQLKTYFLWSGLIIAVATVSVAATIAASQWGIFAPKDYEGCAESAAKDAKSKDAFAVLMSLCRSKFSGRQRPGGGYTFYDSRQDRRFDIVGPNPTSQEMEYINNQYENLIELNRQAEIELTKREDRAREAKAEKKRQMEPRIRAAIKQIETEILKIECEMYFDCKGFTVTVRVKNQSAENIDTIELGWSFIPKQGPDKKLGDCPSSTQFTMSDGVAELKPGGTAVLKFYNWGSGPSSLSDYGYCYRVTNLHIAD